MTLHVLFSPKAEGCPRLALDLIAQELEQTGRRASVAFLRPEPTDLANEFETVCGSVHQLGWRAKGFFGLGWRAWELLRRERPSGIICYTLGQHVPIALAAGMLGIPVVVHVGNAPPPALAGLWKMRLVMWAGAPFVRMHLACSDVIAVDCRRVYGLRKVRSVPNGIDLSRFAAVRGKRNTEAASGFVTVGMVASLASHKDQGILIEALAVLQQRGQAARLLLAGSGSEQARLRALAERLGVDGRIDWLGNVADVRKVLANLDIFAFATTPSEGLGIALVEAMAAGVPVVASDVPACREVLEGGRWGRLVPTRDAVAWADALMQREAIPVPPVEALSRYDIRATWRAYDDALGRP